MIKALKLMSSSGKKFHNRRSMKLIHSIKTLKSQLKLYKAVSILSTKRRSIMEARKQRGSPAIQTSHPTSNQRKLAISSGIKTRSDRAQKPPNGPTSRWDMPGKTTRLQAIISRTSPTRCMEPPRRTPTRNSVARLKARASSHHSPMATRSRSPKARKAIMDFQTLAFRWKKYHSLMSKDTRSFPIDTTIYWKTMWRTETITTLSIRKWPTTSTQACTVSEPAESKKRDKTSRRASWSIQLPLKK